VVDGKVVAAIQRSSQAEGEFRSNISLGGTGKSIVPSEDVAEIAIRTCRVFNTAVAGVDIIMSKRGPLVLELNISPGLEIENITGKDVVGAYLDYLVQ
jgi:ribosomal protein S6--L-glutamate ligase